MTININEKVIKLEKGQDDGESGKISSRASIRRQNGERIEEIGVWEGDEWMEFLITNKNLLIHSSLHLWRMNNLGLPVKLIITNMK